MKKTQCMFDNENSDFFDIRDNFIANKEYASVLLYGERVESCRVSIMIPTFKRNELITQTIDSAIGQRTSVKYEIVIVDNNDDFSDNETLDLIRQYDGKEISYYKNSKNLGMFGNWNRCLELANGEWVLILHDDDLIKENYLDTMMRLIEKHSGVFAVGCTHEEINLDGNRITEKTSIKKKLLSKMSSGKYYEVGIEDMYFIHPIDIMGCVVNKRTAMKVGGFDERWYPTSDYIFLLNLVYRGKVYVVTDPLFLYRVAVNISYRIDHIIGCLEMDISMRKCINKKKKIKSDRKDIEYRSAEECLFEEASYAKFGINLTDSERSLIKTEFDRYKEYCGLKKVSGIKYKIHSWASRWYIFKTMCINAHRI